MKQRKVYVSAAVIISNNLDEILLVKQAQNGQWGLPAGGSIRSEKPTETARRECLEESGVKPRLTGLTGVYFNTQSGKDELGFIFRGQIKNPQKIKPLSPEISAARFFPWSQVQQLIRKDKIYRPDFNLSAFRDWLSGISFSLEVLREPLFQDS
jgi:ADP-ribose pyrophosphatase YjhB (NUDIX family)